MFVILENGVDEGRYRGSLRQEDQAAEYHHHYQNR
jgi:hypothetical protein